MNAVVDSFRALLRAQLRQNRDIVQSLLVYKSLFTSSSSQKQSAGESGSTDTHHNNILNNKPVEPDPEACCGRDCVECVWTTYWNELQAYEGALAQTLGTQRPIDHFEEMEKRLIASQQQKEREE